MNHASLFSGIGGFDLAAREVGWNNVFQCEIDPFCQSVLKYYFPKTVLYEDIKRTDFTSWKGKIDVFEAIKNYAPDDILIISNQGGIEKGFVDREMFEYKFDYISNALEDYTDISVSAYYCDSNNKRNANRKPNTGMIKQYMDFVEYMNDDEDEEEKIVYDTILMIGDASGKEGQFSDSDKKTAENFGCEYMDVDDFVYKYNNR